MTPGHKPMKLFVQGIIRALMRAGYNRDEVCLFRHEMELDWQNASGAVDPETWIEMRLTSLAVAARCARDDDLREYPFYRVALQAAVSTRKALNQEARGGR